MMQVMAQRVEEKEPQRAEEVTAAFSEEDVKLVADQTGVSHNAYRGEEASRRRFLTSSSTSLAMLSITGILSFSAIHRAR